MKLAKILAALLSALAITSIAQAESWKGHGFTSASNVEKMTATSGALINQKTQDFWDWSNAPKAFPRAVAPNCDVSIVLDPDGNVLGGVNSCHVIDGDGDVALFHGKFGAHGEGTWEQVTGTGKYAGYNSGGTFRTSVQISNTQSKYVFEAETVRAP